MELPEDVLQIIKEYSMPLTRPNWRTLHMMPYYTFKYECSTQNRKRFEIVRYNPDITYKEIFDVWWYNYMYNTPRIYNPCRQFNGYTY